ncbi:MAG: hypothetical protein JJT96_16735 [Opitutales bacterium]|nr:hypothetical protein [Opitutales bacterium]
MNKALQKGSAIFGFLPSPAAVFPDASRLGRKVYGLPRQVRDWWFAGDHMGKRAKMLHEWEARLAEKENLLSEREAYVESCENALCDRAAELIVQTAELEHARS